MVRVRRERRSRGFIGHGSKISFRPLRGASARGYFRAKPASSCACVVLEPRSCSALAS
jgi:hypothetical protein